MFFFILLRALFLKWCEFLIFTHEFLTTRQNKLNKVSKNKVIVFGSVHLDIIGNIEHNINYVDSIGEVDVCIGGTAFNIASNLKYLKHDVYISTQLNSKNFTSIIIIKTVKLLGFSTKYFFENKTLNNNFFVGLIKNKELERAISNIQIDENNSSVNAQSKFEKNLEKIISCHNYVIVDCNLSKETLKKITELSIKHQKKIIIAATSDHKVSRILELRNFHCLSMNQREADSLIRSIDIEHVKSDTDLIKHFDCQHILITEGESGARLISNQGIEKFGTPKITHFISSIGAGDAACSGYVDGIIHGKKNLPKSINNCVEQVLNREYSNLLTKDKQLPFDSWNMKCKRIIIYFFLFLCFIFIIYVLFFIATE